MNIAQKPILHFIGQLTEDLSDQNSWNIVAIVRADEVTGLRQENEFFGHEFVDQRVGMFGDDYSGHIYIPVEEMYLKIWFCC